MSATTTEPDTQTTQWPVAGVFLDALSRRDFDGLADCLAPDVRMRAVTPLRELDLSGPDEVRDRFAMWFGDAPGFDVVDASIGGVGTRLHLSWRIRTRGRGGSEVTEIVEQHVFLRVTERIEALDLLCSGFQPVSASEASGY